MEDWDLRSARGLVVECSLQSSPPSERRERFVLNAGSTSLSFERRNFSWDFDTGEDGSFYRVSDFETLEGFFSGWGRI